MAKKTADEWLAEYGESHQNRFNKLMHWVCVPAIVLSLLGMLWAIPVPAALRDISPLLNFGTLTIALGMVFYVVLSVPLAIGMLLFSLLAVGAIVAYEQSGLGPVWIAAVVVFVVAWIVIGFSLTATD